MCPVFRRHEVFNPIWRGGLVVVEHGDPIRAQCCRLIENGIAGTGNPAHRFMQVVERNSATPSHRFDKRLRARLWPIVNNHNVKKTILRGFLYRKTGKT